MKGYIRPKSSLPQRSKIKATNFTPEELYNIAKKKDGWGIDGYEVPRQYYDYHQVMWKKKVEQIAKKCPRQWPPKDWPAKSRDDPERKVPPKRPNYLDDVIKWCNSYYNPERAAQILESKPIEDNKPKKPPKDNRREEFLKKEKEKKEREKNRKFYLEEKEDMIDDIKERMEEDRKQKEIPFEKRMKNKYKGERCQTARCDRITIVADAEFVGEQLPFYNTVHNDNEPQNKQKLFFPDKTCTWKRAPTWKFNTLKAKNEHLETKEEALREKTEEYMNNNELEAKDLWVNVPKSFHNVKHHGELLMKFYPKTKVEEEEHYQQCREENPIVQIGPQQYWKMPKMPKGKNPAKMTYEKLVGSGPEEDKSGNKVYYMDHKITDKRVYKPAMRKCVY